MKIVKKLVQSRERFLGSYRHESRFSQRERVYLLLFRPSFFLSSVWNVLWWDACCCEESRLSRCSPKQRTITIVSVSDDDHHLWFLDLFSFYLDDIAMMRVRVERVRFCFSSKNSLFCRKDVTFFLGVVSLENRQLIFESDGS